MIDISFVSTQVLLILPPFHLFGTIPHLWAVAHQRFVPHPMRPQFLKVTPSEARGAARSAVR